MEFTTLNGPRKVKWTGGTLTSNQSRTVSSQVTQMPIRLVKRRAWNLEAFRGLTPAVTLTCGPVKDKHRTDVVNWKFSTVDPKLGSNGALWPGRSL